MPGASVRIEAFSETTLGTVSLRDWTARIGEIGDLDDAPVLHHDRHG
jgi:hypothetical protein